LPTSAVLLEKLAAIGAAGLAWAAATDTAAAQNAVAIRALVLFRIMNSRLVITCLS
jgi:hypothetical protein